MTKYIGRRVDIGVAAEASRGAGAAPSLRLPATDFDFDDKTSKARSVAGVGKIADVNDALLLLNWGEGAIEGEIGDQSIGYLLYNMLGSLSTSGPTDEAYTHSFSVSNTNSHQSLALLVDDPNTTEMFRLAMLNQLELSQELDSLAMYSAEFMSKKAAASGSSVPDASDNRFTKKHLSVKVASDIASLSGASTLSIKDVTFSVGKNTILDDSIGTAEPEDIYNQSLTVEGELTLNYDDETWKNYMKNNTIRAMEIKWTNTDETIGAGSTNPSLTIQMPRVDLFDWAADYALDEIVTQTISFKALADIENSNDIISTCDLVNGVTSY